MAQLRQFNSSAVANPMTQVDLESASSTDGNSSDGLDTPLNYRGPSVTTGSMGSVMNVPIKLLGGKPMDDFSLLQEKLAKMEGKKKPVAHYPISVKKRDDFTVEKVEKGLRYSSWKLNATANIVRGKSVIEAKMGLTNNHRKGSRIINDLIDKTIEKCERMGMS
jgi:ribosomal protein L22